jgi:hypothetical protein
LGKAITGSIIGCLVGAVFGFGLGATAASFADVRPTHDELTVIHYVGYPHYTANGISYVAAIVCALVGGLGGFAGSAVAAARHGTLSGIATSTVFVLITLFASGLLTGRSNHWQETKFIAVFGGIASAAVGSILARSLQRQEELDRQANAPSQAAVRKAA